LEVEEYTRIFKGYEMKRTIVEFVIAIAYFISAGWVILNGIGGLIGSGIALLIGAVLIYVEGKVK